MELSDNTIEVLHNFSTINPNIILKPGNVLQTISEANTCMARAEVDVEFPSTFGIYDLNVFLSTLSLVDSPRVKFSGGEEAESVVISDQTGRSSVKFFSSALNILKSPGKNINMPPCEVKFTLDKATLSRVKRAASVFGHSELCVSVIDNTLSLSVVDSKESTSHAFTTAVDGTYDGEEFKFVFLISNLKMLDGDYEVSISSKMISHFKNLNRPIEYWVAIEKSSTYGA